MLGSGLSASMRSVSSLTIGAGAVVLSALVGGLFGGRVLATQEATPQHYDAFATALAAVEANYVDEVDVERLVYQAIGGMRGRSRERMDARPCGHQMVGNFTFTNETATAAR